MDDHYGSTNAIDRCSKLDFYRQRPRHATVDLVGFVVTSIQRKTKSEKSSCAFSEDFPNVFVG